MIEFLLRLSKGKEQNLRENHWKIPMSLSGNENPNRTPNKWFFNLKKFHEERREDNSMPGESNSLTIEFFKAMKVKILPNNSTNNNILCLKL